MLSRVELSGDNTMAYYNDTSSLQESWTSSPTQSDIERFHCSILCTPASTLYWSYYQATILRMPWQGRFKGSTGWVCLCFVIFIC